MALAPCIKCGGVKEGGLRGAKMCGNCRELNLDATAAMERERGRRRVVERYADKEQANERMRVRVDAPDGMKWCARCQEFRPIQLFKTRQDARRPSGSVLAAYCNPCSKSYSAEHRLKNVFGITMDDYLELLAYQNGCCAICKGKPRKYMLAVDHNHKTGEIRGLLCSRCNHKLLGAANDDPARLRRAADYLESHEAHLVFGERKTVPVTARRR